MLDWNDYYVSNVDKRVAGEWTGGGLDLLAMGAGVDRDAWGQNVPADVAAQVDAVREKMLGGWSPFQGPMTDNEGNQQLAEGEVMSEDLLYGWPWMLEGVTASS